MDYKKKYEEVLERGTRLLESGTITLEDYEYMFPEIKKSEDEKIRKSIIRLIQRGGYMSPEDKDKAYAWLEKQDKKDSQVILPTFTFDDILALQCCMKEVQKDKELYEQLQSLHDRIHDAYWLERQGEQKPVDKCAGCNNVKGCITCTDGDQYAHIKEYNPAWSEEDKEMLDAIIADIQFTQKAHTHEVNQVVYDREIDWLKSIKDRVQPQPKQNRKLC